MIIITINSSRVPLWWFARTPQLQCLLSPCCLCVGMGACMLEGLRKT
jgi:hypothetical protein